MPCIKIRISRKDKLKKMRNLDYRRQIIWTTHIRVVAYWRLLAHTIYLGFSIRRRLFDLVTIPNASNFVHILALSEYKMK